MIAAVDANGLNAAQRTEVLYEQVRAGALDQLWRTALDDNPGVGVAPTMLAESGVDLSDILSLTSQGAAGPPDPPHIAQAEPSAAPPGVQEAGAGVSQLADLGPNQRLRTALCDAATRTGVPAPTLAAIINAEAAKDRDGCWITHSRNPRSSAAGLGQFLSGTWQSLAETKGTWLNANARAHGWIDANGRIRASARSALLALRYEPDAAINALADYTRHNLDGLQHRGFAVGGSVETTTRMAYAAHHLGLADACHFLSGGLSDTRARKLLCAQIGTARADQQIARAGAPAAAHRAWMNGHIGRSLQIEKFLG